MPTPTCILSADVEDPDVALPSNVLLGTYDIVIGALMKPAISIRTPIIHLLCVARPPTFPSKQQQYHELGIVVRPGGF